MPHRSRRPLVIAATTSAIVLSGALSTAAGAAEGPTPTVRESAPSAQPRALDLGGTLGSILSGDLDLLGTLAGALGLLPADGTTGDPSSGPGGPATPPSSTDPAAPKFRLPTCPVKNTSKLSLARANTAGGKLNVLAPITARASGQMDVEYQAAGTRTRFKAPVDGSNRRVRFERDVPDAQARLGTGILTMKYAGNSDTSLQEVRLRAARNKAKLDLKRPTISLVGNQLRVKASGTVNSKARGVVRLQLEYQFLCDTRVLELKGKINDGRWSIDEKLTDKQAIEMILRSGSVHSYTLFTGYLPQRIRGEMRSFQVLPFQSLAQLLAR